MKGPPAFLRSGANGTGSATNETKAYIIENVKPEVRMLVVALSHVACSFCIWLTIEPKVEKKEQQQQTQGAYEQRN